MLFIDKKFVLKKVDKTCKTLENKLINFERKKRTANKSIAAIGAGRWSNRQQIFFVL